MVGWILESLSGIYAWYLRIIVWVVKFMLSSFLYQIMDVFFDILDFFQNVFKKLAGLGTYYVDGTAYETQDILSYLFQTEVIIQTFISILIVAIFLLGLFTFIQIIRVEYTTEGAKSTKGSIIAQAFKSLLMFVVVPVSCIVGVFFSNVILRMLDTATSGSNNTTVSGIIFKSAAYDANKIRSGTTKGEGTAYNIILGLIRDILFVTMSPSPTTIANLFTNSLKSPDVVSAGNGEYEFADSGDYSLGGWEITLSGEELAVQIDNTFSNPTSTVSEGYNGLSSGANLNYCSLKSVSYFYDLMGIDYLIGIAGCVLALIAFIQATFGLILRIYKGTILFVVSPPVVAIMPLDQGKVFQNWKSQFIGTVLSTYGTIIGFNLFFVVMSVLQGINLFNEGPFALPFFTANMCNNLVQTLFVLVGLFAIKEMTKMLGQLVGADDVLNSGKSVSKDMLKTAMGAGKIAFGAGMAAVGLAGKLPENLKSKKLREDMNLFKSTGKGGQFIKDSRKLSAAKDYKATRAVAESKAKKDGKVFDEKAFNEEYAQDYGLTKKDAFGADVADMDALKEASEMSLDDMTDLEKSLSESDAGKEYSALVKRGEKIQGNYARRRGLIKGGIVMGKQVFQSMSVTKFANESLGQVFGVFGGEKGKGISRFENELQDFGAGGDKILQETKKRRKIKKIKKEQRRLGGGNEDLEDDTGIAYVERSIDEQRLASKGADVAGDAFKKAVQTSNEHWESVYREIFSLQNEKAGEGATSELIQENTRKQNALLDGAVSDRLITNEDSNKLKSKISGNVKASDDSFRGAFEEVKTQAQAEVTANASLIERLKRASKVGDVEEIKRCEDLLKKKMKYLSANTFKEIEQILKDAAGESKAIPKDLRKLEQDVYQRANRNNKGDF